MKENQRHIARGLRRQIFEAYSEQDLYEFEHRRVIHFFNDRRVRAVLKNTYAIVGCYLSMGSEASTAQTISILQSRGIRVCVPCFDNRDSDQDKLNISKSHQDDNKQNADSSVEPSDRMRFVICDPKTQFELSEHRFYQPCDSHLLPSVNPDIMIVPLLAFDRFNHRLGYGKGHYDRYFAAHSNLQAHGHGMEQNKMSLKVGWAYTRQRVEKLAIVETDVPLDLIVTENRVWQSSLSKD